MTKMNKLLATIAVFNQKVNNMHWNLKDPNFMSTHELTDKLYHDNLEFVDAVAEKIAMHDQLPFSTMKEYLENSIIEEEPTKYFNQHETIQIIVHDITTIIELVDEVEATNVIQPLLDEIYLSYDKYRWMFKSHISK